jgi:Flp pilus assembly CpaF family ATPase
MYNGGQQEVKVAHRKFGMCRTNLIIDNESGLQIAKNIASYTNVPLGDGPWHGTNFRWTIA